MCGDTVAQIFLSYSRRDTVFTDKLVSDLEYNGYTVWIDRQGMEGGISFPKQIENAIRNAQAVVLVASPDSLQSPYVQKEISYAIGLGKPVIPVHYREVGNDRTYLLNDVHWIEEFKETSKYSEALQHLANVLGRFGVYQNRQQSPPPSSSSSYSGGSTRRKTERELAREALQREIELADAQIKAYEKQRLSQLSRSDSSNKLKETADIAHKYGEWDTEIRAWEYYLGKHLGKRSGDGTAKKRLNIAQQNKAAQHFYQDAVKYLYKDGDKPSAENRKVARTYLNDLKKQAPHYGDPENVFPAANMPMPPPENYVEYTDRIARPQKLDTLRKEANAAHRAGAWDREIDKWQNVVATLNGEVTYLKRFKGRRNGQINSTKKAISQANKRLKIAEQNKAAQSIYKDAVSKAKKGHTDAAKALVETLRKEAPYYGDPQGVLSKVVVLPLTNFLDKKSQANMFSTVSYPFIFAMMIVSFGVYLAIMPRSLVVSGVIGFIIAVLSLWVGYKGKIHWGIPTLSAAIAVFVPMAILALTNLQQADFQAGYTNITTTNWMFFGVQESTTSSTIMSKVWTGVVGGIITAFFGFTVIWSWIYASAEAQTRGRVRSLSWVVAVIIVGLALFHFYQHYELAFFPIELSDIDNTLGLSYYVTVVGWLTLFLYLEYCVSLLLE